jgi:predicted Ser/Thr protein kinase
VVRELGKGAMGVVYLGRDPVIGRLVALKTIRVAAEDDIEQREFNERFLREAQAAGTLSHPNIVTVHDVGEEEETSFIAMEYVEGKNLKQVIREKEKLSYDRIAEIIAQVADALDYAHRKGIVHRDVKPANIIITPDGTVKITDFGIAKIETSSLTETGQFLGTPNYMSPEQVTGETVDGRSDLFSLGVVLYELLTKKKPFLGDNVTSISYKIVHEDFPRLEKVDPDIPSEFAPIFAKALAKDPSARFQRGADFSLALSEVRARQAEYQMIRDLGEMVAQAEKLGSVAPVEAPSPAPAPPSSRLTAGETTARVPAPEVKDSLEALARRRDDLNPQLVGLPPAAGVDSSGPDWSLDTDAVKRPAAREPAPREPVPSSPGTLISDVPRGPRKGAAGEATGLVEGSVSTQPVSTPRPVIPAPMLDEKGAAAPTETPKPEANARPRPAPALDTSGLLRAAEGPVPARRAASVLPPSLPDGAGPGPRPPALPPDATGPVRRPAATLPQPPPPKERTAGVRLEVPTAPAPKERTAPLRLEGPAPAPAKDRTAPLKADFPPVAGPKERTAPTRLEPSAVEAAGKEAPDGVMRREVNRRWAWAIVGLVLAPALLFMAFLFARGRQIVPAGRKEGAAVEAAIAGKRQLLEDGNRLLADGKIEEAKQKFLELARLAPESVAAREALQRTERLLARKAERDRRNAELASLLAAARAARDESDLAAVVVASDAALSIEPGHPEALALRTAATDGIRRLSRADRRKAEARIRTLRAAAPPAPAPTAAVPAPEAAAGLPLRVAFRSPFGSGTLFVRMNGREVLQRNFDFGRRKGGLLEANVELPARAGELSAWVFSADGSVRGYGVLQVDLAEGARRSVLLGLDASQRLSVALE